MSKVLSLAAALVVAAAITGFALAGTWTTGKSVHLDAQNPSAAFQLRISQPEKILLFVNAAKVTATTRCTKGTRVSKLSRSFATDGGPWSARTSLLCRLECTQEATISARGHPAPSVLLFMGGGAALRHDGLL